MSPPAVLPDRPRPEPALSPGDHSGGSTGGRREVDPAVARALDAWVARELARHAMRFRLMRGAVVVVHSGSWTEEAARQEG